MKYFKFYLKENIFLIKKEKKEIIKFYDDIFSFNFFFCNYNFDIIEIIKN